MNTQTGTPACVVNCAVYREGRRQDITLDQISEVLAVDDAGFVWVGLYEPENALLDKLQEEFGLHDLAIEDAQNAHQRPKLEPYGNSLFIAAHTAQRQHDRARSWSRAQSLQTPQSAARHPRHRKPPAPRLPFAQDPD